MFELIEKTEHFQVLSFLTELIDMFPDKYSSRIEEGGNTDEKATLYLNDIKSWSGKKEYYLWSYDSNRVEVIPIDLFIDPSQKYTVQGNSNVINEEILNLRYRIKGYHRFIDFHVEVTQGDSVNTIIEYDYRHHQLENYRLYYNNISPSNVIKCDDARVELKRYQFYLLSKHLITYFEHYVRTGLNIKFSKILFHFVDTNVSIMYSSLIDFLSKLTGISSVDLDIEYRNVNNRYEKRLGQITKIQILEREKSETYQPVRLIDSMCRLSSEVLKYKIVNYQSGNVKSILEEVLRDNDSYYPISINTFYNRAVAFYNSHNHIIFGLNYDSNNGIVVDDTGSRVGLNLSKKTLLDEIFVLLNNAANTAPPSTG